MFSKVWSLPMVLAFLVAGCLPTQPQATPGNAATAERPTERQVLRVGVGQLVGNLTPQATSSSVELFWPMYDNLTRFGPDFEVRPSLAERWDLVSDNRIWRFVLRKGVTWPTGDPVTAADVAFSFNEMLQRNWPLRATFPTVTGARAIDESTVEIASIEPDMSVPAGVTRLWILPKRYYEQVGFDGFRARPIGSGPYELVEFKDNDLIRFRRRATAHAFRKPVLDELVFRMVIENSQKINGLRTGDLDLLLQPSLSMSQLEQLLVADMRIAAYPSSPYGIVIPQGANDLRQTPLRDKRVRQAIAYAVDWSTIAAKIYGGRAVVSGNFAPPGSLYSDPEIHPTPYDPKKAHELLAAAGYPNGFKLPGGFDTTASQGIPDTVLAIHGYLGDIGIQTDINPIEFGIVRDKFFGRNGQLWSDIYTYGTGDSTGYFSNLRTNFGCGRPAGGSPGSEQYCNPEWDRLFDSALPEPNPAKRAANMRKAARVMYEDFYVIPGLVLATPHVLSPRVRGFEAPNASLINLDTVFLVE